MTRPRQFGSCWLALLAIAALLLSPTAGLVRHHHDNQPGPVCHICQTLHMPALALGMPQHIETPAPLGWLVDAVEICTPRDTAIVHRPSRAPPSI